MKEFISKYWKMLLVTLGVAGGATYIIVKDPSIEEQKKPEVVVEKQYLGFNGMIESNPTDYTDPDFQNAMDSTKLKEIRIPGGTKANTWNWKDPLETPNLAALRALAKRFPNVRKTIVLNVFHSEADQLEMLDSMKAMGLYDTEVSIEISNESNGANSEAMIKFGSVENFAKLCARYRAAITAHQPNVNFSFGIPGGNKTGKLMRDWNEKILAENPDAYLIWHYHNPRYYVFNGIVDTALVTHLIDSTKQSMFGNFPWNRIKVTEYNLRNEDNDEDVIFADDYQHGLAASHMMDVFYRRGVKEILFHNICCAEGNGAIQYAKKSYYLSPTGKALSQFIQSKN